MDIYPRAINSSERTQEPVQPLWLVLDVRTAQGGVDSGIARFVVGLAKGLCEVLADEPSVRTLMSAQSPHSAHSPLPTVSPARAPLPLPPGGCRVLLVSRDGPAPWVIALVERYPHIAAHWSGSAGTWSAKVEKPAFVWSSGVLPLIASFTGNRFLWIAPANFDRPLFLGWRGAGMRERVLQVIHDLLPFEHPKSMGLLFRMQFRGLVRRTLARMPAVVTVSAHSATGLLAVAKRELQVHVVPCAVDESFGNGMRPLAHSAKMRADRIQLLQALFGTQQIDLPALAGMPWFLMTGRAQSYKAWGVADAGLKLFQERHPNGPFLTIRVGFSAPQNSSTAVNVDCTLQYGQYSSGSRQLSLRKIPDHFMAELFRLSSVLLHPSQGEGFGLPPVEAAFAGCPVIYRTGTAVDAHFRLGAVPESFWYGVSDDEPDAWAIAIEKVLSPKGVDLDFLTRMSAATHSRSVVEPLTAFGTLTWPSAAKIFLEKILTPQARAEGI